MADLKTTLCWFCRNAVPSLETGCSWSEQLNPVPGWRATENIVMYNEKPKTSYTVHWCPEYVRDRKCD